MLQTEVLFYKNLDDGTTVIDLRPGGGLQLTGQSSDRHPLFGDNQEDQNSLFLFYTNCLGSLIYVIVPERVQLCPFCGRFIS